MNNRDGSSNLNLNSTKSATRASGEALESLTGDATDAGKTEEQKIDRVAMESAKRAQNRIHNDEETTPGNTIFSK
jgi:hypothetical protein